MTQRNTETEYGSVAKFFHWTSSVLIMLMLLVGATFDYFHKPLRITLIQAHKSLGLTILLLIIARFIWRLMNRQPVLPNTIPNWQKRLAYSIFHAWYLVLFLMLLSGWGMSTASNHIPQFWWLFPLPMPFVPLNKSLASLFSFAHYYLAWTIVIMLTVHIAIALKHHFVDKDNILMRMLPNSCGSKKN